MDQCFGDIGVPPLKFHPCVFIYEEEVGFVIQGHYVRARLPSAGANKLQRNELKNQLMDRFEMTDIVDTSRVFSA